MRDCHNCGDQYTPVNSQQKYCNQCRRPGKGLKFPKYKDQVCGSCEQTYAPTRYRQKYCSLSCGHTSPLRQLPVNVIPEVARQEVLTIRRWGRLKTRLARERTVHRKVERRLLLISTERLCNECGTSYTYAEGGASYCSRKCQRKNRKRIERSKRRAIQRKAHVESVDPLIVIGRDGYTCQACGIATPLELRGTYGYTAPEIDHIIPLSKGGEHSYANTQCLCRSCNASKSDTMPQLHEVGKGGGPLAELI